MDPITIAMLGGTALSSIFGGMAESSANKTNWAINQLNRQDRNRERNENIAYADKLDQDSKRGGYNAAGDRTYYDPVKGWVTDLGARNQGLQDYFYGTELPERRAQFRRGTDRSRAEDDQANQLLEEFQGVQRENPADIEAMLYEASTRGIGENTNDALESALRQALRSGSSNAGDIAAKINEAGAKQRGYAAKDAKLQSMDYVEDRYDKDRTDASQLYNLFASRAGQDVGTSYDPSSDMAGANALLGQFTGLSGQSNGIGANARGQQGGSLNFVNADNGLANAIGGVTAAVGGAGDRMDGINQRNSTNALLQQYITNGGQFDMSSGGIFNDLAGRVRTTGGGLF
ncbi:MAG: hypothetical protein KKH61_21330 [Gammaproteobacteria bacterium]|uniref:Uncharacterized protein n=1 Tax=viral metagenome TaxID=1070528 RepID=A0A6H1ZBT7_9ZZZZ|nr:hypothetical protein [Gammaproteobacteria bacterium]